jgi:hypothetical protein
LCGYSEAHQKKKKNREKKWKRKKKEEKKKNKIRSPSLKLGGFYIADATMSIFEHCFLTYFEKEKDRKD